ncbi:ParB/RepB/Spo0J family partition protein [Bremerella sp. TYQ1]|nr:ParB/RepB/Spo0J family partition protein [Bremerella volcania]
MNTTTRPIAELRPHSMQQDVYGNLSELEFQALVVDIDENGLRQPIEIAKDGTIVDGHQRVRAYQHLGRQVIEVVIYDGLTQDEIDERFIKANLIRRQLDPLAKARAIQALVDLERDRRGCPGVEFRDRLAQQLGGNISGRTIDRYLKLLELPRSIQDAVSIRQLPMNKALKLGSLPIIEQERVAQAIADGAVPKQAAAAALALGKPKETIDDNSPAHAYAVFVFFLEDQLGRMMEHADEIVGKASRSEATASLLEQAAIFCKHMQELELAAHDDDLNQIRSRLDMD